MAEPMNGPIWDRLHQADPEQQTVVRQAVEHAAPLLGRIQDTLPTYTLHDAQHARNVLRLMAELLGDRAQDLTPLEAAILILAAYFHDIGMVFVDEERSDLRRGERFGEYLSAHPGHALAMARAGDGELPRDVAEGYCRWVHPDRAVRFLHPSWLGGTELRWEGADLVPHVADVCRSHGYDAGDLKDDRFQTDFFGNTCDLRLCAVLLRLADILDFDRSRSPRAVQHYLGLSDISAPAGRRSAREWAKHYASSGFRFPDERSEAGYRLPFHATPDHPGIEQDINEFLDVIEAEFGSCQQLVRTCSDRWRDLPLPGTIGRKDVLSQGYTFGPYRFETSRSEVLQLFTGENLYSNPHAFVRELLQNALDASRDRAFSVEARTGRPFIPDPVRVRDWRDDQGRLWVEFNDGGRGMDEHILRDYFLQIGRSYYTSDEFTAELLGYEHGHGREFLPISRFGIGVLSCFVVGDLVELSTRRENAEPIRFSMWGRDGFFALQTPPKQPFPTEMPGPSGPEPGYRTTVGTTIAVRLDPRREQGLLDVRHELGKLVAFPEVPVEYDGEPVGGDATFLDRTPEPLWLPLPRLRDRLIDRLAVLGVSDAVDDNFGVRLVPVRLDLAPVPECRGQFVVFDVEGLRRAALPPGSTCQLRLFGAGLRGFELSLECPTDKPPSDEDDEDFDWHYGWEPSQEDDEQRWWRSALNLDLETPLADQPAWRDHLLALRARPPWSHNGINLPGGQLGDCVFVLFHGRDGQSASTVVGHLALHDRLRPDVDISRDVVRAINAHTRSAISLTFRRSACSSGIEAPTNLNLPTEEERFEQIPFSLHVRSPFWIPRAWRISLGTVLTDQLIAEADLWPSEPIFETPDGLRAAVDLEVGTEVLLQRSVWHALKNRDTLAVLASQVRLGARRKESGPSWDDWRLVVIEAPRAPASPGERLFPPFAFVPIEGSDALFEPDVGLNERHPLARWVLDNAPAINDRYPALFVALRDALLDVLASFEPADAERINTLLERLRTLDADVAPARSLWLEAPPAPPRLGPGMRGWDDDW
jgi:hypothetical protein